MRCDGDRFVASHVNELLRISFLVVGDLGEAEDLVQECLLRVARRWPRVHRMDHPGAYARRVLVNLALDGKKRRTREREELSSDDRVPFVELAEKAAANGVTAVEAESELIAALVALPPRQRAVLVLRYFEDLSEAQVAAILDCSLGTVKSTASRGLSRLRQTLERDANASSVLPLHTPDKEQ
jgi:RNA polymerase sigma-70 factor (sigma-E family)